jgi:putative NADH-flavin reductase
MVPKVPGVLEVPGVLGFAIVKLLILGATGHLGRQIVTQALEKGHTVTILARDRSKVDVQHERLRVVEGDVTNNAALGEAMREQDAVISAIGRGMSFKSENLIERSVPAILTTMQTHGIRRLMFTSAMGVGASYRDAPVMAKLFFRTLLRGIYADKAIGEQMIRNSALEWTIVQPVQLNDGPLKKNYRAAERLPMTGMPQISRADTAHFILDRLHDPSTIGKTLILAD